MKVCERWPRLPVLWEGPSAQGRWSVQIGWRQVSSWRHGSAGWYRWEVTLTNEDTGSECVWQSQQPYTSPDAAILAIPADIEAETEMTDRQRQRIRRVLEEIRGSSPR